MEVQEIVLVGNRHFDVTNGIPKELMQFELFKKLVAERDPKLVDLYIQKNLGGYKMEEPKKVIPVPAARKPRKAKYPQFEALPSTRSKGW